MAIICPAILAKNKTEFKKQVENVAAVVSRVHIDFTDGDFAKGKTLKIEDAWWPHSMLVDLHIMYKNPKEVLGRAIKLVPNMVIVHAEAEGDFTDIANKLHKEQISVGVALLPETPVDKIKPALSLIDHVLIFSGDLGSFGGTANLELLEKVKTLKKLKPSLEIGWDGGVNDKNAQQLIDAGVDVVNAGGFIQKSKNPAQAVLDLRKFTA